MKKKRRHTRSVSMPQPEAAASDRIAHERRERRGALAHYLPYHDFLDGVVPQVDKGLVTTMCRLAPLAGDALTVGDLNGLVTSAHTFLNGAPDNVELQFLYCQRLATPDDISVVDRDYGSSGNPDLDGFARARREHVEGMAASGQLFETTYFLCATFAPSPYWYTEEGAPATSKWHDTLAAAFSTTGRTFKQRCRAEHEAMLADVRRQLGGLQRDLESFGMRVVPLTDDEAFTLCYEYLNPRRRGVGLRRARTEYRDAPDVPEFYARVPEARCPSPREQLSASDVIHKDTHLAIDGVHVRSMRLKSLPQQSVPGMIEKLTDGLRFPFTLSVNIRVPQRAEELSKIRRRMRMQMSILSATLGSIKPDTTDAEVAYRQLKSLAWNAIESDQRAVYVGATLTFEGGSIGEIEDYTTQVTTAVRQMSLAEAVYDRHSAKDVWLATAPGNSRKDYWKLWTTADTVAAMLPIFGRWRGTRGRPFLVYANRKGELVSLDPQQLPTPHIGILGLPGSGKSVLLTDMILKFMQDPEALCYVVDSTGAESLGDANVGIGRSAGGLQRLASVLRGQYVLCDLSQMPNMNPLAIRPQPGEADDLDKTEDGIPYVSLGSAARFIETLALPPGRDALDKEYVNLILHVLQRTLYNAQDPSDPPIFRNFLEQLSTFTHADTHVAKISGQLMLWLLSAGDENNPMGRYLNRRDRVFDPESRFIVFDMHGIERYSEYRKAVMMLVTSFLDRQVIRFSNASRRKLLIYDEAGRYISGPMGDHMAHFAAVLRKRNAVLAFASQALIDVTENTAGARLLANCGSLFMLKLGNQVQEVCRHFGLTARDGELIAGLSTTAFSGQMTASREAFLKVGDFRSIVSINIDDPTYWLSTSHPPDVRLLRILTKVFGVPGRDIPHVDFYRRVAEAMPSRSASSELDLAEFEAEIDRRKRAGTESAA